MRFATLLGTGLLAATTVAVAAPAEAQYYRGYHDGYRGYRDGYRGAYRHNDYRRYSHERYGYGYRYRPNYYGHRSRGWSGGYRRDGYRYGYR